LFLIREHKVVASMQFPLLSQSLAGLRVVDLTRNLAGPYCTMILADLGADVVKIESTTGGDDSRSWQPPSWNGESATFLSANRNKRSLAVNLDTDDGRQLVRELAAGADVLVESFRPGSLRARGLDYESLRELNPAIIYCSISGYGGRGPKADRPGYDPVIQADTGIMELTGYPADPPARLGIGAVDLGTALWATVAIQAAIANRSRHGEGTLIEASLFETATWWLSYHLIGYLGSRVIPHRQGTGTPFIAPYEVFATAEGSIFVGAGNDRLFQSLADELGVPELGNDPRYGSNEARVTNRASLRAALQEALLSRPAAEWEKRLGSRSIPCSAVRTVADLAADPQLEALGLLTPFPHPRIHDLRLVDMPVSVGNRRGAHRNPPPELGEHTHEILAELGIDDARIRELRARGVIA
jgi:crotonobetainyl-CoA:carnitine CoA-transferase CaiB-like acyl-CoA transferase